MQKTKDVLVVGAVRTAVGSFGGALKDVPLADLATTAIKAVLSKSGVQASQVGHVVMGNVIPTEARDLYLSRVASIQAGISHETPAFNVNRLCGSGLQAIISAAEFLRLGECEIAIGAGAESMSRSPYLCTSARWGTRMGDVALRDLMVGALMDPFQSVHMGITAENVAQRYGITREMMDRLAVESHRRAARALSQGYFQSQIAAVDIATRKGVATFDTDEHVKPNATLEELATMKPVFRKEGGTVTVGNASGINDGASAVTLATEDCANRLALQPMARLVAYAYAGVDPEVMGMGPVPATRRVLAKAGLTAGDLDVIECNEAFGAQACAVIKELDLDPERVNPNGSAIALGHPLGATGAIATTKLLYELQRRQGRYGLVTMCIGGGQGIAAVFERWW